MTAVKLSSKQHDKRTSHVIMTTAPDYISPGGEIITSNFKMDTDEGYGLGRW